MSHTQPAELPHNQPPAVESPSGQAAIGEVTSLRQRMNQLTAGSVTSASDADHLPQVTLTGQIAAGGQNAETTTISQNSPAGFVKGLGQSLLHTLVQSPLEGVAQLVDHTAGAAFDSHLYAKSKDLIIAAPAPAAFGSAEWHGQAIGGAVGMMPLFLASRGVLRGGAGMFKLTEGLVASEMEAAASKNIFTTGSAKLILEGGATGAAYAGVFKPQESGQANYWTSKAISMSSDFGSFATMTAGSIFVGSRLRSAALPLVEKYPGSAAFVQKGTAALTGAISGIPAAGLETTIQYAQQSANNSGRDGNASGQQESFLSQFAKNAYSYAAIGGVLSAAHLPGAKAETMSMSTSKSAPKEPILAEQKMSSPVGLAAGQDFVQSKATKSAFAATMAGAQKDHPGFISLGGGIAPGMFPALHSDQAVKSLDVPGSPFKGAYLDYLKKTLDASDWLLEMTEVKFKGHFVSVGDKDATSLFKDAANFNQDVSKTVIVRTGDLSKDMTVLPDAQQARDLFGERRIGTMPEAFMSGGLNEEGAFTHLDALAKALRSLDAALPPQKKSGLGATDLDLPTFNIRLGYSQMSVTKIGIGEVAHVYKLTADGQDFALKIPNDPGRLDVHGTYAETAAFVHLAKEKVSDLIDFHAANPGPSGGWMLTEYADRPVLRSGRPVAKILADQGLILGDDWSANRGPGNVAWDLGGIEPKKSTKPTSLEQLQEVLQTTNGKMIAGRNLDRISDAEIKAALLLCLDTPSVGGQVARTAARRLDGSDLAEVLDKALATPGAAGRAAFELDRLARSEYITPLFYKALLSPEARVEAVKQIDKLPREERKAAFDAAFVYPDAREMATRAIPSILDPNERALAQAKAAAFAGSNFVQLQMLSQARPLTVEESVARQKSFEGYFDHHNLATGELITTGGETNTFENWKQKHIKADEPFGVVSNQELERLWNKLNESQKNLDARDMDNLSASWFSLAPEKWRTMNAAETVQFAGIVSRFSLGAQRASQLFERPTLVDWLSKTNYADLTPTDFKNILHVWEQLPVPIKSLDAPTVRDVASSWDRMSADDWQKVSLDQIRDVARTIFALNLYPTQTKHLVENPDFAAWYVKPNNSAAGSEIALRTFNVWSKLTTEEKALPAQELGALAEQIQIKSALTYTFGPASAVADYLYSPAIQHQATKVIGWINTVRSQNSDVINKKAEALLETLAREGAPADQFKVRRLETRLSKEIFYGDGSPLRAKVDSLAPETQAQLMRFIDRNSEISLPIVNLVLADGYVGGEEQYRNLQGLADLTARYSLGQADSLHLWQQGTQGLNLSSLELYLSENSDVRLATGDLIRSHADAGALDPKNLEEVANLGRLPGFSPVEIARLDQMRSQGLSITRLVNHLQSNPEERPTIQTLLKRGGDATDLNNSMRLDLYLGTINLRLVEAIKKGQISAADVLVKTRDWHSGAQFSELLTNHIIHRAKLSPRNLDDLNRQAIAQADQGPTHRVMPLSTEHALNSNEASTFVDVLKGIEAQVPADRPIVLLGRDAWPLLPLLRATGRDVQYFLWSRLQNSDQATKTQWLREIPPNAAVIDTGYSGSIIDAIKQIDPGVTGYLMSSHKPLKYPTLMSSTDHSVRADRIENLPKLIYRSSSHTASGGAIARRSPDTVDGDHSRNVALSSRWYIERQARHLLSSSGLPTWEAWRYSKFVGLTPQERLGLSSKAEVAAHYDHVYALREVQRQARSNEQNKTRDEAELEAILRQFKQGNSQ